MSNSADLIRDALDKNAEKAKSAAVDNLPDLAEMYASASLKLSQALATLMNSE